jgi:hypothetical protein
LDNAVCSQISQTSPVHDYAEKIGWNPHALFGVREGARFNFPPRTHPAVLHRLDEFETTVRPVRLHRGYQPA